MRGGCAVRDRRRCASAGTCGFFRHPCALGHSLKRRLDVASVARDTRDGQWLARWRDPSGRQRKKSFGRRVDAQRWLDQMRAETHRGQYVDPAGGRLRLGPYALTWMAGQGHLKPSTAYRYQGIVNHHIVAHWGSWPLGSVTHSDVAGWIAGLSAGGLRPGSVRQIHRVFAMIMSAAVVDGRIGRSPADGVKLPRQVRAEPRSLTSTEIGRLATAAGPDNAPLILVLAFTGLRFGEAAGLRVRRVDFGRRRLDIREIASEVGGRVVFGTPKTHQRRTVVVPRSLMPLIEAASEGKSPDDHVFTSPDGSTLRMRNWRSRVFDPARAAAGLHHVRPHDLRHTAASLAIASGATVKAVQSMLGHASAAMTLDIYASLFADELDAVADALDAAVPQMCHIASSASSGANRSGARKSL